MRKPERPDDIRRRNVRMFLAQLRSDVSASRTGLARETGLSPASVTSISLALAQMGVVQELQPDNQEVPRMRGRPQVRLALNPTAGCLLAIILKHNQLDFSLVDYCGSIRWQSSDQFETAALSEEALLQRFLDGYQKAQTIAQDIGIKLRGISIAVQGIVDLEGRTLIWSPISLIRDVPLAEWLENETGCPTQIGNDTAMIAHALMLTQNSGLGQDYVALEIASGIGMAVVRDGRTTVGLRSSANEFGHMIYQEHGAPCRCGEHGCIEAYAADYGIMRSLGNENDTLATALEKARQGDGPEREAFELSARAIGFGLRNLFALMDPVPVALVGSGTAALDLTQSIIQRAMHRADRQATSPPIFCFDDGENLKMTGTILAGLERLDDGMADTASEK